MLFTLNLWCRASDDIFGYTRENNLEKLTLAIKENADIINSKDADGYTVLHLSADRGYLDIVTFLIDSGADLNIRTDDEETALHLGKTKRTQTTTKTHCFQSVYI